MKKQYTYGDNTFLVSNKFTGKQKFDLRKLKSKCKKELIALGESNNPTDAEAFELMMEGPYIDDLMKIVFYGQDTSVTDFSEVDYFDTLPPVEDFFEIIKKKNLVKVKPARK